MFDLAKKVLAEGFSLTKQALKSGQASPNLTETLISDAQEFLKQWRPDATKFAIVDTPTQPKEIAQWIDHTILKPDAAIQDIRRVCQEARENDFATVCVNGRWVELTAKELRGAKAKPIAVIGFPLGVASTASKVFETKDAIANGAAEIDMVIRTGDLKSGLYFEAALDIAEVVRAAGRTPVKVILETCLLTDAEKVIACVLSKAAEAAFVKTSTGFSTGGATENDIALMRSIVGREMGVKASGGVRTTEDAIKMLRAGANRIGASSSVAIIKGNSTNPSKGNY